MNTPRIAIVGDMERHGDSLTNAGAIAQSLAAHFSVEVGVRSVARTSTDAAAIEAALAAAGVTSWITSRPDDGASNANHSATVRMGDPLDIPFLFEHDILILAIRDRRLRRFLADLPVHTKPNVRIMTSLHIDQAVLAEESLIDLIRFDVLFGARSDFEAMPELAGPDALKKLQARMRGTNLRMAVCWDEISGQCTVATVDEGLTQSDVPAATRYLDVPLLVATVAISVFHRELPGEVAERAASALVPTNPSIDQQSIK